MRRSKSLDKGKRAIYPWLCFVLLHSLQQGLVDDWMLWLERENPCFQGFLCLPQGWVEIESSFSHAFQDGAMSEIQPRTEELFAQLVMRINSLPERAMRREVLGEALLQCSASIRAELLQLIVIESATNKRVVPLLLAFQEQRQATHRLGYEAIRDTYQVARERGYMEVMRFFLTLDPVREEEDIPEGHHHLSKVALGRRKTMARGKNIQMLEKLLLDPDPSVIRYILRNPRITEKEVLQITTRRPNQEVILLEISASNKWFERYPVKAALCKNPYSPPFLVMGTLSCLNKADLREIASNGQLHIQIRKRASELVIDRQGDVPFEEETAPIQSEGIEVSPLLRNSLRERSTLSFIQEPSDYLLTTGEEPEA